METHECKLCGEEIRFDWQNGYHSLQPYDSWDGPTFVQPEEVSEAFDPADSSRSGLCHAQCALDFGWQLA